MKKIIAKTNVGTEYMYYRFTAYQVSNASAEIICQSLNTASWNIADGEKWKVYTVSPDAWKYETIGKMMINHGKIRIYEIWRAA